MTGAAPQNEGAHRRTGQRDCGALAEREPLHQPIGYGQETEGQQEAHQYRYQDLCRSFDSPENDDDIRGGLQISQGL